MRIILSKNWEGPYRCGYKVTSEINSRKTTPLDDTIDENANVKPNRLKIIREISGEKIRGGGTK